MQQTRSLRGRAVALQNRLETLRARRDALQMPTHAGVSERPSATLEDAATSWIDRFSLPALHGVPSAALRGAVAHARTLLGESVRYGASACDVQVDLPLHALSARKRQAFGLPSDGSLRLTLHFDPAYHRADEVPSFTVEHVSPQRAAPMVAASALPQANHRFRVGVQLTNILNTYLQRTWIRGEAPETLLMDLVMLARGRLEHLGDHCVVCDAKQPAHATSLRPGPCEQALCISQAETLAHGFEPQDVLQAPAATDFMLTLTYAAAKSGNTRFFERLPGCLYGSTPASKVQALTELMDRMPSIERLLGSADMIGALEAADRRALPTLAWLTFSNAGYVEALPPAAQFAAMQTPHQFRIIGGPRAREAAFAAHRKGAQTAFAFHGAPLENWHSIIRTGLREGSQDSGLGFHGSAYGSGVYVSAELGMSSAYAPPGRGWPGSGLGENVAPRCVGLCEVRGPDKYGNAVPQQISVYPEAAVALRYLFVYPGNVPGAHVRSLLPELWRQRADVS